jgi:hypothetical protein
VAYSYSIQTQWSDDNIVNCVDLMVKYTMMNMNEYDTILFELYAQMYKIIFRLVWGKGMGWGATRDFCLFFLCKIVE